jgi:hypothetical protein
VARTYAGILGPLALITSLARGALHAWPTEKTLLIAWMALVGFAALGWLAGWVAGRIVEDEVRGQIAAGVSEARPETKTRKAA